MILRIDDTDVDHLGVEDLLDLVADDVVERLQIELAGYAILPDLLTGAECDEARVVVP